MKAAEVAKRIGVSRQTIMSWVRATGVEVPPMKDRLQPDEALRLRAVEMYRTNRNAAAVGRELGVTGPTVIRWARMSNGGR